MGNCLGQQSPKAWGGDDWGSRASERLFVSDIVMDRRFHTVDHVGKTEDVSLLGEKNGVSSTEIKIKLTKKQMEEVLAKVSMEGMSIEQILTQLVNKDGKRHLQHRTWRPELQSIPEVN